MPGNNTDRDQGAIGQFAIGEFNKGDAFISNLWAPFSEPRRFKTNPRLAIALMASGAFMSIPVDDGFPTPTWLRQMNEPVRQKKGMAVRLQPVLAYLEAPTQNAPFGRGEVNFAEETMEAKYHYPWSEPKRFLRGLGYHLQDFYTADTNVVPDSRGMGWYSPLTEPKRFKRGLASWHQQTIAQDTLPIPTSRGMGWFANLSEPKRFPKGLKAYLQRDFFIDTKFIADVTVGFLSQYSEPVRFKKGLAAYAQQSFAYPPRILPNPNVTVTINGIEENRDVALFAVNVYNSAPTVIVGQGARVSVIEITPSGQPVATGGDPVSIREV